MKSEYEKALITCQNTFTQFVTKLKEYLPHIKSQALLEEVPLWIHPQQGVGNLINSLTLNYQQIPNRKESVESAFTPVKPKFQHSSSLALQYKPPPLDQSEEQFEDLSYIQENRSNLSVKSYKRGPYKSYSLEEKQEAVNMLMQGIHSITEISKKLDIPCKNIKRWASEGVSRKRGGGRRRTNPNMENKVLIWLRQHYHMGDTVDLNDVQNYALDISKDDSFKASRGWALKFTQRYDLRKHFIIK